MVAIQKTNKKFVKIAGGPRGPTLEFTTFVYVDVQQNIFLSQMSAHQVCYYVGNFVEDENVIIENVM